MAIMPPLGASPPPPLPQMGGLGSVVGPMGPGAGVQGMGDAVAGTIVSKLRPVWKMVGELIDYLIENPEIAPAAKSIISLSFGSAKKMGQRRDKSEDALAPEGMPPIPPLPLGGAPLPPNGPIPGLPMPPGIRPGAF